MIKKGWIHIVITLVIGFMLLNPIGMKAQQLPVYSHYIMSDYILNPALTGRYDYQLIQSNIRYQWVGINDAPKTIVLSANIPHKIKKVGLGGYLFNDATGAVSRSGFNFSYAYHIRIDEDYQFGMGVNGGLLQYRVNGPELILADEAERYLFDAVETAFSPDFSFGTCLYSNGFFLGFSLNHLFKNQVAEKLFDKTDNGLGHLARHIYVMGGGKFKVHELFELEPSALIKYVSPSQIQLDISSRVFYNKEIWMGITYRTRDAVVLLAGYDYKDMLRFAYAFDITTSDLRKYSTGSHEIVIGYRFNKKEEEEEKKIIHRGLN